LEFTTNYVKFAIDKLFTRVNHVNFINVHNVVSALKDTISLKLWN